MKRYWAVAAMAGLLGLAELSGHVRGATLTAKNEADIARPSETIVLKWSDVAAAVAGAAQAIEVTEQGEPVVSQTIDLDADGTPDEFVFQADFKPGEAKTFELKPATTRTEPPASKVFGRFVPERLDDFAWENDRVAFRIYGPALEKSDPAGSGIDIWCKRTPALIIDKWYKSGDYHKDHGDGLDGYKVGHGRGCGGTGIWKDGKLYTSGNAGFKTWKRLANGPVRFIAEFTYEPWDIGGEKVSEIKRITLDAGHQLNQVSSTFTTASGTEDSRTLQAAIGLGKHADRPGQSRLAKEQGWIRYWDAVDGNVNGNIGVGAVMPVSQIADAVEAETDVLLLANAVSGRPILYYVGGGWDKGGHITAVGQWDEYLTSWSKRVQSPIRTSLSGQ